jgi:Helix-turn-helix domain
MDNREETRQFLTTRRAKITPQQAGLAAYGGNRRVKGLRRHEVATLAGVSVEYYAKLERGNLAGVSDSVLEEVATMAASIHQGYRRIRLTCVGGRGCPLGDAG